MQEQGWGRIVAITSLSVRQPMAQLILSNTARPALRDLLGERRRSRRADLIGRMAGGSPRAYTSMYSHSPKV